MTTAGAPVSLVGIRIGSPVRLSTVGVGTGGPGEPAPIAFYTHTQSTPSTVWLVQHNLGHRPSAVSVFSLDFAEQWDEVGIQHLDANSLRVTADVAISGIALVGG